MAGSLDLWKPVVSHHLVSVCFRFSIYVRTKRSLLKLRLCGICDALAQYATRKIMRYHNTHVAVGL